MAFETPLPLNVPIELAPSMYFFSVNYEDNDIGGAAEITLIPRAGYSTGNGITKQYLPNSAYTVDGRSVRELIVTVGLVFLVPGVNHAPNVSGEIGKLDLSSGPAVQPATLDTLMRSVEIVAPRQGEEALTPLDESVASGGSGSGNLLNVPTAGSLLYIQLAISQDTLGTSPHSSYISIIDPGGNTIVKVRGAVNSPLSAYIRAALTGTYKYSYENGDSVAHWFLINFTIQGA